MRERPFGGVIDMLDELIEFTEKALNEQEET